MAPPPPLDANDLVEMLELSEPIAKPAHDDMLFGDDTPEDIVQQALAGSDVAQAAPLAAESPATKMASPEFAPEPDASVITQADIAQAQASQADVPQSEAAAVAAPPSAEAAPAENAEPQKSKRVSQPAGRPGQKMGVDTQRERGRARGYGHAVIYAHAV